MTAKSIRYWGCEYSDANNVRFHLWASGQQHVTLRLNDETLPMNPTGDGGFELTVNNVAPGSAYSFILPDGSAVPDPASRAQQGDVNGPSLVCDPHSYVWRNTHWQGRPWEESVVYELHIGTFTPEGTFRAAADKLPYLASLGITMIELMPVSQAGGNRGWGYDGVLLYAPHSAYGTPDELKAFVDTAHGLGLSVVLDIVLNHFGPEGNYLPKLAPDFFHPERMTPWGNGIAYDVAPVRQFIVDAPLYWLTEFRFDGLRFDAIDQIEDTSEPHVLIEIAARIRAAITDRPVHLTTEDSRNVVFLHPREEDGSVPLFTGEWNDDLHNAVHVMASGETHAWYQDFAEKPEQWVARALAEGFAYQGERSPQTGEIRGVKSTAQPPAAFVDFIQNHDQVGNRAQGDRLLSLIGEERTRFSDHDETVPDPNAPETFARSKLDWDKLNQPDGQNWLRFTQQLLQLRQRAIVPLLAGAQGGNGRVIKTAPGCVVVNWTFIQGTLSLALNTGDQPQTMPEIAGETLFAWPEGRTELLANTVILRFAQGEPT